MFKDFLASFLQRKVVFVVYTIIEKWILLSNFANFSNGFLIFIFGKDIVALIALSIISFEKIKIDINKIG